MAATVITPGTGWLAVLSATARAFADFRMARTLHTRAAVVQHPESRSPLAPLASSSSGSDLDAHSQALYRAS